MRIGEKVSQHNPQSGFLEVSSEVYDELDINLRGAASVAHAIRSHIPSYQSERLEVCIAKAIKALGNIDITSIEEEREPDPVGEQNDRADRRYHERVDAELEDAADRKVVR